MAGRVVRARRREEEKGPAYADAHATTAPPLHRHPIKFSRARFTIGAHLLLLLIGSGTVYGYNALRPVLIQDGAFSSDCEGDKPCDSQKLSLNFVETCCFVLIDVITLPIGFLLDYLGSRWIGLGQAFVYAFGFLCIALASHLKSNALYVMALMFLAWGPGSAYLTALASAKMLHDTSKTHIVSALVALCYEVSPMFIYLLQVVIPEYLSFPVAFAIMGIVCTALSICAGATHLTLEETKAIDVCNGMVENEHDESKDEEVSESLARKITDRTRGRESDRNPGSAKGHGERHSGLLEHVIHPRYLFHLLFMTVVNTKNQFYVATFADQINYFSTEEEALYRNKLFDVGFFVSALFVTPLVIVFLGAYGERSDIVFGVLWFMTMIHATFNTFGNTSTEHQIIAMCIFFALKPLKWAACAEFLHHPPYHLSMYGRLYGIVNVTCAGGAFMIYPLTKMTYEVFGGDFFIANLILTVCEVCTVHGATSIS
mmetsp:Transcript_8968/g.22071  ORF Transcript_8968/g.22071 Transcript_8968/m.22071 type:complete len:486 (-) Transcript_8968:451-1908(-)